MSWSSLEQRSWRARVTTRELRVSFSFKRWCQRATHQLEGHVAVIVHRTVKHHHSNFPAGFRKLREMTQSLDSCIILVATIFHIFLEFRQSAMRRRGCGFPFYRNGERWRLWSKGNENFFFEEPVSGVQTLLWLPLSIGYLDVSGTSLSARGCSIICLVWGHSLSSTLGSLVSVLNSFPQQSRLLHPLAHSGPGLALPYLLYSIICPCTPCKIFSVIFWFAYVYICVCLQGQTCGQVCLSMYDCI